MPFARVLHKGQKSYATKFLEKRYRSVIVTVFPVGWIPESVVLEGMRLINTSPLVTYSTMKDYAKFLIRRFAIPYFEGWRGSSHPGLNHCTPKAFEQRHRDNDHATPLIISTFCFLIQCQYHESGERF